MQRRLNARAASWRRALAPVLLLATAGTGCAAPAASSLSPPSLDASPRGEPTRAELSYVATTARTLYRERPIERTAGFLDGELRLCVRSPVRGGYDHTLLTLQRRITDDFIPQAADDVLIERTRAAVEPCRRAARWVPLR